MKNPIKLMWVMSAAALAAAAGMNCAGPKQAGQTTTTASPPPASAVAPAPATISPAAPVPVTTVSGNTTAAKTADDELNVAIRDASDCLNDNIPKGSKIVILNIESNLANLSEYIIDELIANAIKDKNFSVVDRRQLEAIQSEQKFQMSGAVDDKDALEIGKFFGAQTIVSGAMREMGGRYRMTVRALAVQTAVVQSQCNQNVAIAASAALTDLVNSGGNRPAGAATYSAGTITSGGAAQPASTIAPVATAKPAAPAEPPIQGIMVPGETLTRKLEWLTRSADSRNTYIIEVNADDTIAPYTFEYKGAVDITVVLRGDNVNRTIRLQSNGSMFTVNKNVTFILDNNITLMGHRENTRSIVHVYDGTFKMKIGSAITGNNNKAEHDNGGGVCMNGSATFEMSGGVISGNTARRYGGGLALDGDVTFIMSGGTIFNNSAPNGGGVYAHGKFTMRGGTITGNTANKNGGGVYLRDGSAYTHFTKTGGIVTGYNSDQANGNAVKDEEGNILARSGHAVWLGQNTRKETTSGPNANMSFVTGIGGGPTGAWDK